MGGAGLGSGQPGREFQPRRREAFLGAVRAGRRLTITRCLSQHGAATLRQGRTQARARRLITVRSRWSGVSMFRFAVALYAALLVLAPTVAPAAEPAREPYG